MEAIISSVCDKMFHIRPSFADGIKDHLPSRAIWNISWHQPDQKQSAICVNRDMALTTGDLLACVITTDAGMRSLDTLAVDDTNGWVSFASCYFTVQH
ncbi:hypothetical protein Asbog_02271 [Asaia bogorensis NBRC 16594]|nr:hypothetical protein Asbog_02271 [Asaia bogorensis NBRC 16594]